MNRPPTPPLTPAYRSENRDSTWVSNWRMEAVDVADVLVIGEHVYVWAELALLGHHSVNHTRALRSKRAKCVTD